MKLCSHCGRKYPDETLNFCLDDGSELIYGPTAENPTLRKALDSPRSDADTAVLPDVLQSLELEGRNASAGLSSFVRKPFFIGAAVLVVLVAAGLVIRYQFRGSAANTAAEIHSIAVLPLDDLSGDPSQEYFSDGMTDALISDLSQIRSLKVISRTSVMRFKGSHASLPDIARKLNVDAIVEGTVTRAGGRVRVTAQLIPATTDSAIWSRNYEREMSDILKLQSDVAQAIAGEIKAQLTVSEQRRFATARTLDPAANEEFLLGRYHLQKLTDGDLEVAIGHFNRAIEIEPNYAAAWAGLSHAWFQRGIWGHYSHTDVESYARSAAQKALDLDPDLSDAHTAMCFLNSNYDWDWQGTEYHAKRAIELDPSNWEAYDALAWYLLTFSRFDEMKQVMSTAEQLDPVSSNLQSDFGRMLYRARDFGNAEAHLKRAIELDDKNLSVYGRIADVLSETGRYDEALAIIKTGQEKGDRPALEIRKAFVYARMGQRDAAMLTWNAVEKKTRASFAILSTTLGDNDKAFDALNLALDQHETVLPHLRVDPAYDKLHSDPRWPKLLARMNLPPS
jgi:TolB-like protein/Tfp pilus assembly protein PilF